MYNIGSLGLSLAYNVLSTEIRRDIKYDNKLVTNSQRLQCIRSTLEQHGGIFSKLSQMLAYEDTNCSVFSECKPYAKKETLIFLKKHMELIDKYTIDYNVYKSGSIGQVHIGTLTNSTDKIAIKVQYNGLYEKTESDISALNTLASFMYVFADIKEAIKEIKKQVYEELNYFKEAENHTLIYNIWNNRTSEPSVGRSQVCIPKLYNVLCTDKVLVTEFLEGQHLSEFIQNSTQESRNKIASDIVNFVFTNLYDYNIFYSDTHYGNIIILPENRLSVIDFGCLNFIEKDTINSFKQLHTALKNKNKLMFLQILTDLKIINSNISEESKDYAYDYFTLQYTPWIIEDEFEFTTEWLRTTDKKDVKLLSEWKLPQNLVYLNKIPYGLYHILTALNAKGSFYKIFNNILNNKNK